jgi:hypothetical protein
MLVIGWLAIILPDDQAQALVAELRRLTMWGAPLAWKVTAFNHLGTIEFDSEPFVPGAGEVVVPHDEQDSPAADQFPYVVRACDLIKKDVALPME